MPAIGAVLIDLSGTLHVSHAEIPGSVDALRRLREAGLPVRFVTNTTTQCAEALVEGMNAMGFGVQQHEVIN